MLAFARRCVSSPALRQYSILSRAIVQKNVVSQAPCGFRGLASKPSQSSIPIVPIATGVVLVTGLVGVYMLGQPEPVIVYSPEGEPTLIPPEPEPPLEMIENFCKRAFVRARTSYEEIMNPPEEDLLPDPLPKQYRGSDYTIILDLEETLIHTEWSPQHGWRTMKRPDVDKFLLMLTMGLGYEVVLFSDKEVTESQHLIEQLDPQQLCMYRLYKGHKRKFEGDQIKDLSLLNRDLSKVIVIDDDPTNFKKHPHNGIKIEKFTGDTRDKALMELIPFLRGVMKAQVKDVREVIKKYEGTENIAAAYNEHLRRLSEQQQQQKGKAEGAKPARRGWFS